MAIETVNPATGARLRTFEPEGPAGVDQKLARAATAFAAWSRRPVAERTAVVRRAAEILAAERGSFGRLMTLEMGKPIAGAEQEADKCATACRYYADHGEEFLRAELVA